MYLAGQGTVSVLAISPDRQAAAASFLVGWPALSSLARTLRDVAAARNDDDVTDMCA